MKTDEIPLLSPFYWIPIPLVRILLVLCLGIVSGYYTSNTSLKWVYIILLLLVPLYGWYLFSGKSGYRIGIFFLIILFLIGYILVRVRISRNHDHHIINKHEFIRAYTATIGSYPEKRGSFYRAIVNVEHIQNKNWTRATGQVLVYFRTNTFDAQFGDKLLISGTPELVESTANPGQFDYQQYLALKNIYFQHFVDSSDIHWLSKGYPYSATRMAYRIRTWAATCIESFVPGEQQQAVVLALTVGLKYGIDSDVRASFAASGAMHVLAVSGLHVGVIYGFIIFLLKPLKRFKFHRSLEFFLCLSILWIFAVISGLSPSVLRAVTMFSFFSFSRVLRRSSNPYNTLAGSAMILLLFDPLLLWDVGFQLSYSAVLGIMYGYKRLCNWIVFEGYVWGYIWQLTSLALSAQATTSVLSVFYFHQFPVYFFISNLLVVPLASIILISSLVMFGVSSITIAASVVGKFVSFMVKFMMIAVEAIEQLPGSMIENIKLTSIEMLFLILGIIAFVFLFEQKRIIWLYAAVLTLMCFSLSRWMYFYASIVPDQFIVYSLKGYQGAEWSIRGRAVSLDSFPVQPNHRLRGVRKRQRWDELDNSFRSNNGFQLVLWNHLKVGLLDKSKPFLINTKLDVIVISNNALKNFEYLHQWGRPKVVLDGTNTKKFRIQLMDYCKLNNIPVHSVLDSTAFIINSIGYESSNF